MKKGQIAPEILSKCASAYEEAKTKRSKLISELQMGKKNSNNTSGFVGVSFDKHSNKWIAVITINKKYHNLGRFDTPEEANEARLIVLKEYKEIGAITKSTQQKPKNNTSGFIGVSFNKRLNGWVATINKHHLGVFYTPEEASEIYQKAKKEYEDTGIITKEARPERKK
jgi:hypothetical protein